MARGCAGISHNSGTFLKISTLKILPCPPARFSNFQLTKYCHVPRHVSQIFNFKNFLISSDNFLTYSQLLLYWECLWFIVRIRVRVCVRVRFRVRFCVRGRGRVCVRVRVRVMVRIMPLFTIFLRGGRYAVACRFDIESVRVCIVHSIVARPLVSSRHRLSQSSRVQPSLILHFLLWSVEALRGSAGLF